MSAEAPGLRFPTYDTIGVRPLINCRGTYTIISGSLLLPEARAAMEEASRRYVHLDELAEAVGARLAELMECEWGLIVNGCAAALCQVAAACVAGTDPEKMERLPDATGMKDEVIVQKGHRHGYDRAVRMTGARLVEVESLAELEAAVSERTAMLLIFGDAGDRGPIPVPEMTAVGRRHGIPSLVDAAAERPDVPNRYLAEGASAVAYSGGKCLRGPQASGLILGERELLEAAFRNGAPHHSLGRPMKAGKEEVMGLLAAVEMWVRRDHEAEWREWLRRLEVIGGSRAGPGDGGDRGQRGDGPVQRRPGTERRLGPGGRGPRRGRGGRGPVVGGPADRGLPRRAVRRVQPLHDGGGGGGGRRPAPAPGAGGGGAVTVRLRRPGPPARRGSR